MTKAIRIHANGGPEVMMWEESELPPPGAGQARVRHTAIGVNFSDMNVRRGGFYIAKPLQFPLIIGNEAAGMVERRRRRRRGKARRPRRLCRHQRAILQMDRRLCRGTQRYGNCLIKLPAGISERQAAAMLLKGLTASMIINRIYRPKPGDTILIHAAASGVGLILPSGRSISARPSSVPSERRRRPDGEPAWLRPHDPLSRGRLRRRGEKRLRRTACQPYSTASARIPSSPRSRLHAAVRHAGELRQRVGSPAAARPSAAGEEGSSLAVSRQAFSRLIGDPATEARHGRRTVRPCARGVLHIEIGRSYALRDAAEAHGDLARAPPPARWCWCRD